MRDAAYQIVLTAAREFVRKASTADLPGDIVLDADATTVSTLSDSTPDSQKRKANGSTREPPKKFRLSPIQANLTRQSKFHEQQRQAEVFAKATQHYYQERQKKNGMSAAKIAELYNKGAQH